MYTLYILPDACSLATHVALRELQQPVEIIHRQQVENFTSLNPVGTVPVLVDGNTVLREGAAAMIYLLNKHNSPMLPANDAAARHKAVENIMFANATMHPAYGRLFFAAQNISNIETRQQVFESAAQAINSLWQVVEDQLGEQPFLGGTDASAADIMLAVYSRWGDGFPVSINIGPKAMGMIEQILAMPSFQQAVQVEQQQSAA